MEFTFWKNNRIDAEYKLSSATLKKLFKTWYSNQDQAYKEYYSSDRIVRFFIMDSLKSVFDENEYQEIYNLLRPTILKSFSK